LLSIPKRSFTISLLECQDQWMMFRFFRFHLCTKRSWMGNFFCLNCGLDDVKPYLIGDKGYLLLPQLMIPYKQFVNSHHTIWKALYNKQLCRTTSVVENSFGILKKSFRKLLLKSHLNILFLPNVVVCCYIFYNMILDGKDQDIEILMI